MYSAHRPTSSYSDVHDYYDTVPPAHRFSDYNSYSNYSPRQSSASIPLSSQGAHTYSEVANDQYRAEAYAEHNEWREKADDPQGNKRRWMVFAGLVAFVLLIVVAIIAGVVASRKGPPSSSGSRRVTGDPSNFEKDPELHKVFWGMSYTPKGSQLPDCGNSLDEVIKDVQLLSQLTTRVRLYGADCDQSALVLEAIKLTKVDLNVYLGNYVIATDNGKAYERQREIIKEAIEKYGTEHIEGITVGNEFMLNYLNANGGTAPNTPIGDAGAEILIANIKDTRSMLSSLKLDKNIPVGTSDAGYYFNTKVLEAVDYGMSNVHPWFANTTIEAAAAWTNEFFTTNNVAAANALPNQPKMYIAETGWPTKSSDASNANNGASDASEANLQIFLDTFVCQANANNTGYFYFELFDEKWKDIRFGGVEGWWGLFDEDRKLKSVKIPTC